MKYNNKDQFVKNHKDVKWHNIDNITYIKTYIKYTLKIQQTVTSLTGVKRRMVTIESPAKRKCILQLWRDQVVLGDTIGI